MAIFVYLGAIKASNVVVAGDDIAMDMTPVSKGLSKDLLIPMYMYG